jgi:hypothetical protein
MLLEIKRLDSEAALRNFCINIIQNLVNDPQFRVTKGMHCA